MKINFLCRKKHLSYFLIASKDASFWLPNIQFSLLKTNAVKTNNEFYKIKEIILKRIKLT